MKPANSRTAAQRHVALLRGINVGGRNSLPMRELVAIFESAGCSAVTTYVQSGNVIFSAGTRVASALATLIPKQIRRAHGIEVPLVLRTANELASAIESNPFLGPRSDSAALHLMFLADEPAASAIAGLDPRRSPPDEFRVVGRDIYLRCPNGLARSKLTNAYFDSKLSTVSTCRNWRTVSKLLELASA